MSSWNGNRFSVYTSEEKSVLGLIKEMGDQTNYNSDEIVRLTESDNKKVSHQEMQEVYKVDKQANFTGSWFGIKKPTQSDVGLAGTVEQLIDETIPGINSQLEQIEKAENNFFSNPIFYGADPTGNKPSSDAINNCIIANKGKSIKFTPGKYLLDKPILTPYFTDEQVNIDFNGSVLITNELLEYVVGVGCYNYSSSIMPNRDNYNNKTCYAEIKNIVIDAPNANIGIFTNDNYWYPRLKNISIFNTLIGIKVGNNIGGWSSDLYLENALIQCRSYKISNCVGIILNGSDNKLINCRLYNAPKGIEINSEGNIFNNIHVYLYGHLKERDTLEFRNIYPTTIAIVDNGNNNFFNLCYTDSYSTHFKVNNTSHYKLVVSNSILFTNVSGFDDVAFDFSNANNVQYLTIRETNVNLKNSGVNGNIGIKVSTTQRKDDMCLNWCIENNVISYITKDLLQIDRKNNFAYPFSGSYKMKSGVYYIVGYIPIVAYQKSYTVNITGTGTSNQRARIYINASGIISEINNLGVAGTEYGIGAKKVTFNDGLEYIEASIMTYYEKNANLGLSFDISIDGMNYGIMPIFEKHIHGDPNLNTTTPTITKTFGL